MQRVRQSTDERTDVHLLTGFLGSGKTSLLQRHLRDTPQADTAVLINEFGEVGLDHRLVSASDAPVELIENGCLCCAVSGRLRETLRALLASSKRSDSAGFRRLVIETSGLACPEPILNTIRTDYALAEYLRMGTIVTALDATAAIATLARYAEAVHQVSAADRIVITKADLVDAATVRGIMTRARTVNPLAEIVVANHALRASTLFDPTPPRPVAKPSVSASHSGTLGSFTLTYAEPLDWARFSLWLAALLHRHGRHVLRFKAILELHGYAFPVVLHGVQHLMFPPRHLPYRPRGETGSSLVFIVDGVEPERIKRSLRRFMNLGEVTIREEMTPASSGRTPSHSTNQEETEMTGADNGRR